MSKICLVIAITVTYTLITFSQEYDFKEDKSAKIKTWILMQLIPSPSFYQDADGINARVQFGFKWHITPVNISFNPNKYVSPLQFIIIDPVRRYTGSMELFIQPELTTSSFKYADKSIFGLTSGARIILPVTDKGEAIALSIGGKYTYRKSFNDDNDYYYGAEAGIYFVGGLLGFQFTKNFNDRTKYNFNFYLKYF